MKTALLQCNPVTGDIAGNVEKIAAAVRRAGDVDLCVTPELALSGLNPGDYLSMNDFVEGCRRGLDILAETFKDGPDLLVGAPVISVYDPKLLSNAAVHIHGGTWEVVSRKIRHPASQDPEARFFDRGVSCGIMTLQAGASASCSARAIPPTSSGTCRASGTIRSSTSFPGALTPSPI